MVFFVLSTLCTNLNTGCNLSTNNLVKVFLISVFSFGFSNFVLDNINFTESAKSKPSKNFSSNFIFLPVISSTVFLIALGISKFLLAKSCLTDLSNL